MLTGHMPHTAQPITTPNPIRRPDLVGSITDLETLLPISLIRTHTKTDDVPHVTDEQIVLYRQAAFEVCEKYTGLMFTETKVIDEPVDAPWSARRRGHYKHRLAHPSADGRVYLYGSPNGAVDRVLDVATGARSVSIPVAVWAPDASPCCRPNACGEINHGMRVLYKVGFNCEKPVPAGIITGILKLIAWYIAHPGDEFISVRNKTISESQFAIGTNNGAIASGAVEQWRIFVDDAI